MPNDYSSNAAYWNAAAQLAGTTGTIVAQGKQNRKTREWNERMYAQQRADALADWHAQNFYNSPAEMRKRLRAANLNVGLMYGGGVGNMAAGAVRSSSPGTWNPKPLDFTPLGGAVSGILESQSTMKQIQVSDKQIATMDAEIKLKNAQAYKALTDVDRTKLGMDVTRFDLMMKNRLSEITYETALEGRNKLTIGNQFMIAENDRRELMMSPNLDILKQKLTNLASENDRIIADTKLKGLQSDKVRAEIPKIEFVIQNLKAATSVMQQRKLLADIESEWNFRGYTKSDWWVWRALQDWIDQAGFNGARPLPNYEQDRGNRKYGGRSGGW